MFYLYSVYFLLLFKCTKCTFYFYGVFTKTRMNSASNTEIVCCSTRTEAAYHRLVLLERSCELCRFSATLEPLCFVQHWKLVSQTLVLPWPQFHVWDLFFFYLFFTVEVTVCDQMHAAAFYLTKKNVFIASHSLPFVPAKGLEIMLHATAVNCTCSCGGHSKIIHPCPVYALS